MTDHRGGARKTTGGKRQTRECGGCVLVERYIRRVVYRRGWRAAWRWQCRPRARAPRPPRGTPAPRGRCRPGTPSSTPAGCSSPCNISRAGHRIPDINRNPEFFVSSKECTLKTPILSRPNVKELLKTCKINNLLFTYYKEY